MGQVFQGVSPGGRKVAVKLIKPEYAGDPQYRRRFAFEVEAARKVGGFHTAQVVDADATADPPWLVTAFVDGPSLQNLVSDQGPLTHSKVLVLAAGLAEGLAAIHECGLVHRDLKPGNVIMAGDGPRIIDFGIARAADAGASSSAGVVIGTFSFMSPEQIRADQAGPASDVFALGSLLTFAATGKTPFAAASIPAIAHRILTEPPDLSGITGELRDLISSCLAKDPTARPTPADILAQLSRTDVVVRGSGGRRQVSNATTETLLLSRPDGTRPQDRVPAGPERRRGIRRRVLVLGALAAASAGAATTVVKFWPENHKITGDYAYHVAFSRDGKTLATIGPNDIGLWDVATGNKFATLTDQSSPVALAFSPDGKTLASADTFAGLLLRDTATGVATANLTTDRCEGLAFGPGGKILASSHVFNDGRQGQIRLWNTGTRRISETITFRARMSVGDLAFSPNGKILAASSPSGAYDDYPVPGSWLWDVSTGRTIATFFREPTRAISFSPNGKTIVTAGASGVRLYDVATKKIRTTMTGEDTNSAAFSPDGTTLITGGEGGVRLWNTTTGRVKDTLTHNYTFAVAFSPDGKTVASGTGATNDSEPGTWRWTLR